MPLAFFKVCSFENSLGFTQWLETFAIIVHAGFPVILYLGKGYYILFALFKATGMSYIW